MRFERKLPSIPPKRPFYRRDFSVNAYEKRRRLIIIWVGLGIVFLGLIFIFVFSIVKPHILQPGDSVHITPSQNWLLPAFTITPSSSVIYSETPVIQQTKDFSETLVDIPALQKELYRLVNLERHNVQVQELAWDEASAQAGILHAIEMSSFQYVSSWNLDGYGPDSRYSQAGGLNAVRENVYGVQINNGSISASDWLNFVESAHQILMTNPSQRENIMAPEHNHIGIGIAYNSTTRWLAITEEFTDQYVKLQTIPISSSLDAPIEISGIIEPPINNLVVYLAYEPFPFPLARDALAVTKKFESKAQIYQTIPLVVDEQGKFTTIVKLNLGNQTGLYHIRISGKLKTLNDVVGVMTNDIVVQIR